MEIQGPISIGMVGQDGGVSPEIHIGFKPGFRGLSQEQQGSSFAAYMDALAKALTDPVTGEADRAGIKLIHQICS